MKTRALSFRIVGTDETGIDGFRWRYRKNYIFPGRWSDWILVEGERCPDSCGWGGVTDQEDGTWEFEICAQGFRPIHGYVDLRDQSPGRGYFIVTATSNA